MARRKAAYRKRHQNRFSMFLVSLVVLMIMVVVAVRSVELQQKIEGYDIQIASLNAQIEAEQAHQQPVDAADDGKNQRSAIQHSSYPPYLPAYRGYRFIISLFLQIIQVCIRFFDHR